MKKVIINAYPETSGADRLLTNHIEQLPTRERGRAYRAMLLTGLAFRQIDPRFTAALAEIVDENTSLADIVALMNTVFTTRHFLSFPCTPSRREKYAAILLSKMIDKPAKYQCLLLFKETN